MKLLKLKHTGMIIFFLFALLVENTGLTYAKGSSDYPELLIAPRASERIKMEMKKDRNSKLTFQLPITISSTMLLTAGIVQTMYKDGENTNYSAEAGIGVGLFWLATNLYVSYKYQGYTRAYRDIKAMPRKSMREKLIRERVAEERINELGKMARRMVWFSSLTSFAAAMYMQKRAESDSVGEYVDFAAAAISLLPLILSNKWIDVAKKQKEYKKKIYGPIIGASWFKDPNSNKMVPGMAMTYTF